MCVGVFLKVKQWLGGWDAIGRFVRCIEVEKGRVGWLGEHSVVLEAVL